MINGIDHIGIAVKNIDEMLPFYTEKLGLTLKGIEVVTEQKVKTAILQLGLSKIELLEATDPESPIAKYIEKKGEGIHHIAIGVNNAQEALDTVAGKGVNLIDKAPRGGVEGTLIGFLHPKDSKILLEFVEGGA
ncbi:methylmalonyl-CoA epimerase [Chloroflexota bacterium]